MVGIRSPGCFDSEYFLVFTGAGQPLAIVEKLEVNTGSCGGYQRLRIFGESKLIGESIFVSIKQSKSDKDQEPNYKSVDKHTKSIPEKRYCKHKLRR